MTDLSEWLYGFSGCASPTQLLRSVRAGLGSQGARILKRATKKDVGAVSLRVWADVQAVGSLLLDSLNKN